MLRNLLPVWVVNSRVLARLPGVLLGLALLTGCPIVPDDGGGNGGSTVVTGDIITLATNRSISVQEDILSILYNLSGAPTDAVISSFFVPVTGTNPDNYVETGPRVTITTGLMQGTNQAFSFVPAVAGVGIFLVGLDINAVGGTDIDEVLGDGTIRVEGAPNPTFVQPNGAITVPRGDVLLLSIDAGDPENNVQWRMFYYQDGDSLTLPADQLGVLLATGA